MADLLENLEKGLRSDASTRLRGLVDRIDHFILAKNDMSTAVAQHDSRNRIQPIQSFDGTFSGIEPLQISPLVEPMMRFPLSVDQLGTGESLPFEILQDWPWPFDSSESNSLFPDLLGS